MISNTHPLFQRYTVEQLKKFQTFHSENPHVYEEFKALAFQMLGSGRRKYSAEAIFNVIRWHHDLSTTTEEQFKINNNYRSIYARVLQLEHAEFEDFFASREPQKAG